MGSIPFTCCGEELSLLPERALWWAKHKRLLIADAHFGKVGHFRKAGLGLPYGAALNGLLRLEKLLLSYPVREVFFLGDLFHSELNREWLLFKDLIRKFPNLDFILIEGNHDILHPSAYANLNFTVQQEPYRLGPFDLSHHPLDTSAYNLCGHLHPGVRLNGDGRQSLRLACFHFSPTRGTLPAFGEFTGTARIKVKEEDRVFVLLGDEVKQVN